MIRFLLSALVSLPLLAQAAFVPSAVTIASTGEVYGGPKKGEVAKRIHTEISKGKSGAPTVVLINGLIYDINRWDPVAALLEEAGLTVIRMSFAAQPESLRLWPIAKLGEKKYEPEYLLNGLDPKGLAQEVNAVLKHHAIRTPVTVVGLSYGAVAAAEFAKLYPRKTQDLLLISPLVVSLDRYDAAGGSLRQWLDGVRFWENASCAMYGWINPMLCASQDFWYDAFYNAVFESYLHTRVQDVPKDIEPSLYKKSVFHLVRAVRDFDLKAMAPKLKNVHLIIAEKDEAALKADQEEVWSLIPDRQKRSLGRFQGVHHAAPDEAPAATAEWIEGVARKAGDMQNGVEYVVEAVAR